MPSGIRIRGVAADATPFNRELTFDDDAKFRESLHRIVQATNNNWESLTPVQEIDWVLDLIRRYLKEIAFSHRVMEKAAIRQAEDKAEEDTTFPLAL